MKNKLKILVIASSIVALLLVIFVIVYNFQGKQDPLVYRLGDLSNEFMIVDVDENYNISINCDGDNLPDSFVVNDINGLAVKTSTSKSDNEFVIKPDKGSYVPGMTYSFSPTEYCKFADEELQDATTLYFTISKDKTEIIEYISEVKKINKKSIVNRIDNIVLIKGIEVSVGDLVSLEDQSYKSVYHLYRVTNTSKVDDAISIEITDPMLDEIYKNIELFKSVSFDSKSIVVNEDEIIEFVKGMDVFNGLSSEVKADDNSIWDVLVKPISKGVEVTVKYVNNGSSGIKEVNGGHAFEVVLKFEPSAKVNIQTLEYAQIIFDNNIEVKVTVTPSLKNKNNTDELLSILSDSSNDITKVSDAFSKLNSDQVVTEKNELKDLKLFSVRVPIEESINLYVETGINQEVDVKSSAIDGNLVLSYNSSFVYMRTGDKIQQFFNSKSVNNQGGLKVIGTSNVITTLSTNVGIELAPGSEMGMELNHTQYLNMSGFAQTEEISSTKWEGFADFSMGYQLGSKGYYKTKSTTNDAPIMTEYTTLRNSTVEFSNKFAVETIKLPSYSKIKDGVLQMSELSASYKDFISNEVVKETVITDMKVFIGDKELQKNDQGFIIDDFEIGENDLKVQWKFKGQVFEKISKIQLTDKNYIVLSNISVEADNINSFDKNVSIIDINGRKGLIDFQGNIVLEAKYKNIVYEPWHGWIAYVNDDSSYLINKKYQVTGEEHYGHGFSVSSYVLDTNTDSFYYVDYADDGIYVNEQTPYPKSTTTYELASLVYTPEDWFSSWQVDFLGKSGLISNKKKMITKAIFDNLYSAGNGLFAAKKDGKWGYIDSNGKTVIDFVYNATNDSNASKVSEGTVVLNSEKGYGVVNIKGEVLIPLEYQYISDVKGGKAWVYDGKSWKVVVILP